MWGRGPRGNNATWSAVCQLSVTSATTHKQIGPFWHWFPGGWVCIHSRTLWVSPMNSTVRLGVPPIATSSPTVFSVRGFEVLFPCAGTLGSVVCVPSCSFRFICTRMWDCPPCQPPPCQVRQLLPCCLSSLPVESSQPSCSSLPFLLVWMNVYSLTPWLSEFHTVQFSVSSDCFLFLNLLSSFFWLCEEAQYIYIHVHLGRKSVLFFILFFFFF